MDLKFDIYKKPVAIEVELTDPADLYNNFPKILLAYNVESVEVAVEIVYDNSVTPDWGKNLPKIQKVQRDLDILRRNIDFSCPVWTIGLKVF